MNRVYIFFQMSEVTSGGYTVFPQAGIKVPPIKVRVTYDRDSKIYFKLLFFVARVRPLSGTTFCRVGGATTQRDTLVALY